jgi:hypothetical protein
MNSEVGIVAIFPRATAICFCRTSAMGSWEAGNRRGTKFLPPL